MTNKSTGPLLPTGNDLPPHILSAARMMARDCAAPGEYLVRLVIPAYKSEAVSVQTARLDVIRSADVMRKTQT